MNFSSMFKKPMALILAAAMTLGSAGFVSAADGVKTRGSQRSSGLDSTYTVTYYSVDNGTQSVKSTATVDSKNSYEFTTEATDAGYNGWYGAATADTSAAPTWAAQASVTATSDMNMYQIKVVTPPIPTVYQVTFDANGGTPTTPEVIGTKNDLLVQQPVEPTRDGFTFKGWFTDKTAGTKFDPTAKVTATQTVYAQWTENAKPESKVAYTVTFNAGDGTPATQAVKTNEAIASENHTIAALPTAPTRAGFNFGGWYTDATLKVQFSISDAVTKDMTVYAKWVETPVKYNVTFNENYVGAPTAKVTSTGSAVKGEAHYVALPVAPVRAGYNFLGWFTAQTGGIAFTGNTNVTTDTTVYAQWAQKAPDDVAYDVVFNENYNDAVVTVKTVMAKPGVERALATYPAVPARVGYTFKGWSTAVTGGNEVMDTTKIVVKANTTYYAQWTKNVTVKHYNVTFVSNVPNVTDITLTTETYGNSKEMIASLPVVSKQGHKFLGWYSEKTITPTATRLTLETVVTVDTTYYAVWEEIKTTAEEVKKEVENTANILTDPKASPQEKAEAVENLLQNTTPEQLKNDVKFVEKLAEIAEEYAKAAGVTLEHPVSQVNQIKSNAIQMVGAELSAGQGETIKLTVAPMPEKTQLSTDQLSQELKNVAIPNVVATKSVQMDLDLGTTLRTPVTFTFPIPEGMARENLVLLHKVNGVWENVNSKIYGDKIEFTVTSLSPFIFVNHKPADVKPVDPVNPGNGGSGGGSSGGGGGTRNKLTGVSVGKTTAVAAKPVSTATATSVATKAVAAAKAAKSDTMNVRFQNATSISPDAIKAIANLAMKNKLNAKIYFDTMNEKTVAGRIYFDPTKSTLTTDLMPGVTVDNSNAKMVIVNMAQKGTFGQNVEVAVKADLTKLGKTAKMYVYSYDAKTKKYTAIADSKAFVDTAGYLHFSTSVGGTIVVTAKAI